MRYFILALSFIFAVNLSAQTSLQYQAHVPAGTPNQSKFSVYLADDTFDENSHLNASALWYVENVDIEVSNGIVNYTLKDIPDNILVDNQSNIFVYAYVNGQKIGRLPLHRVPYALKSKFSTNADLATNATNAVSAKTAEKADTSTFARNAGSSVTSTFADSTAVSNHSNTSKYSDTSRAAGKATLSDLATYASTAAHSAKSDTSRFALDARHSFDADTSVFAYDADHANFASTSAFATNSARSVLADTAKTLVDNSIEHRNFQSESVRLSSLEGSSTAPIGSYATRGLLGIAWEVNPQHRTNSVAVYTTAPLSLPTDSRWVVSRVAVDYNIATVTSPTTGQLVTIFNGSTANNLTIKDSVWGTDTNLDYTLWPNQSRTLWFNGTDWVVVE
jgi:hypothetical protein